MGEIADYYREQEEDADIEETFGLSSLYSEYGNNICWTQRNGKFIEIKNMTTAHIENTVGLLNKNSGTFTSRLWIKILESELAERGIL